MQLPDCVKFTEPVPSLDIKAGDHVHFTRHNTAVLVRTSKGFKEVYARSLDVNQVRVHLHLAKPVRFRTLELTPVEASS